MNNANIWVICKNPVFYFHFLLFLSFVQFINCKRKEIVQQPIFSVNYSTLNEITDEHVIRDMPEFQFENISCNFGKVTQGEKIVHTFHFKNVGNSVLIIHDVETTCGCTTTIPLEKPIYPEEKGEIKVSFDSEGKFGDITVYVVVSANTNPNKTILTIHANVWKR